MLALLETQTRDLNPHSPWAPVFPVVKGFEGGLHAIRKKRIVTQAAAEKADQSWTGAQIKFIESKYPSIRLVSIPHANHFLFQSNEADVLHEMNFFIQGLNVRN